MIRATRARTTAAALAGEVAVLCEGIPTRYRSSKRAREGEEKQRDSKRTTTATTEEDDIAAYEDPLLWREWQHADLTLEEEEIFDLTSEEEEEETTTTTERVETWDLTVNLTASPAEIRREAQVEWLRTTRCDCQDCVRDTPNGRGRNVIEYERDVLKLRLSRHRDIWMWSSSIPSALLADFPSISEIVLM